MAIVDEATECCADWREKMASVEDAYTSWSIAEPREGALAFGAEAFAERAGGVRARSRSH